MPKIKCKCNFVIRLGEIPSSNQFMIISDVEFDKFEDKTNSQEIYMAMKVVAKCPNCGRLHVFWNEFDHPQTIYKPEE
jgi:hypothetical protein